jgi:stage II sporulation protein D
MGRRAAEGFDLYGTVEDQVYGPVESERPLASRCVTTTRAQVVLSQGWPIRANYSSTCGGISADVWEAWPVDPLPYLVSHRDRDATGDYCTTSPHYRWREEWKPAELAGNLERYAPSMGVTLPPGGVGEIVDVVVASRSRSGRVWRLDVETTTGRIQIPAYVLRQMMRRGSNPAAILRSNLFKIDVRRDRTSRKALAIVASGAGNGHGAGLCQTGALGMAKRRMNASAILGHYYPSTELLRLY